MHKGHLASGATTVTLTDTGQDIVTGFTPEYVKVINVTSAFTFEWWAGMADAEAYKTTGSTGVDALITSLGITPYAGVAGTTGAGFSIGADTDMMNATAEVLYWTAWTSDS